MKLFRTTLLVVALLAAAIMPASVAARTATYGVAFYNLENLFDTINNNGKYDIEFSPKGAKKWDSRKYWSKIDKLGYSISKLATKATPSGPAVIGVSEIENRSVLEDLVKADAIRDWNLQIVHHDSPDLRGVDVGLLYNPELFKVLQVKNYPLDLPFKTRDQMCVIGLLGTPQTGYSRVAVIVNHWPSRRGGDKSSPNREAAAALSKKIAQEMLEIDPNMGVIILGDLNDDPFNKSCAEVLGAVRDVEKMPKGGFYNPFWKKLDEGIGSYIYSNGWNLFDQIIVNSNLVDGSAGITFDNARVHNDSFRLQQEGPYKGTPLRTYGSGAWTDGYSDHLPTQIFLKKSY